MSRSGEVAAVVIGRNEGARLVACLDSLRGRVGRIVYVDSGSTDGSVAAAETRGATVVALDPSEAFSAARGRNAGAAALRAADPTGEIRFIQFVDGDCAVAEGWVAAAAAFLDGRPDAAAVCGRRRERRPEATIYNRLCDMEWNTPVGPARACGGDALMRREAFERVGGFDPAMIAGEEPELCVRLRAAGWTVWRLDREMTSHDAAIERFGQWWRRAFRSGWAYAEGAARHGAPPERHNVRELRSIVLWGAAVPSVAAACLLAAATAGALGFAGAALLLAAAAAAAIALVAVMVARVAVRRRARFGDPWRRALLYGAFTMLGKPAQALGALRRLRERRGGGAGAIIEYKATA